MNREEFFYRPETVRDTVEGKVIKEVNGRDLPHRRTLVDILDDLNPDTEAIQLEEYQIIPKTSERGVPYTHSQNFLKRGPYVRLETPKSIEDAMRKSLSALASKQYAFTHNLKSDVPYAGCAWWALRLNQMKIFHLRDVYEGQRIIAYAHQSEDKEDKCRRYKYEKTTDIGEQGAIFIVEVPSRTAEQARYQVTLHHIPILQDNRFHRFFLWRELTGTGHGGAFRKKGEKYARGCTKTYDPITFRTKSKVDVYCPHEVAAYIYVSQKKREEDGVVIRQPFPLVTQQAIDFYLKLQNNVLIREERKGRITGKVSQRNRVLNETEVEILLWEEVKKYGYDPLFYSRTRLQERKWVRPKVRVAV